MKKMMTLLMVISLLMLGCSPATPEETTNEPLSPAETTSEAAPDKSAIILSTTTSTQDSGLLDYILPDFTAATGYEVKVVAVGTGAALQNGRDGNADVLLVHAKADEEKFVAEGYGVKRYDVMYNDFVIVGPNESDPAIDPKDPAAALQYIADKELPFVSRGDDSGTHKKELALWKAADMSDPGETPSDWYHSAGKGMGDVLNMANELQAYTMSDRATYLAMRDKLELKVAVEGDERLFNQYGVIAVNPEKHTAVNREGAAAFVEWIISPQTQEKIAVFGRDTYGESLFTPNAK